MTGDRQLLVLLVGALLITPVKADDVGVAAHGEMGNTFQMGVGMHSCGRLIAAVGGIPPGKYRETNTGSSVFVNEYAQYQQWLAGFVSGFNSSHASQPEQHQQVTGIDSAGMDLWMRNWCNKHPTQTVSYGAAVFINEMLSNAAAGGR
jgi:hypothetical protein